MVCSLCLFGCVMNVFAGESQALVYGLKSRHTNHNYHYGVIIPFTQNTHTSYIHSLWYRHTNSKTIFSFKSIITLFPRVDQGLLVLPPLYVQALPLVGGEDPHTCRDPLGPGTRVS